LARPGQTKLDGVIMEPWSPVPRHVARRIESMISSGDLSRGTRLPSQRELSTDFGVSRASVREALLILEAAGTIKTEPGRGTYVLTEHDRTGRTEGGERSSGALLGGSEYSKLDICQFRLVVEGQCARLAAMRINDEQIAALERNLATFKSQTRAMDAEASAATDFEFHQLFVQFAGVRLFTDLHLNMRDLVMQAIRIPTSAHSRAWEPVVEHERILEAVRRRDPDETRYYMQSHIVRSSERHGIMLAADLV
jgi:GntR family transcriptional regulator, transcriptional repressor for pyruvate dehydrogenase complex